MASILRPIMPGSFSLDGTLPPKLDLKVGAKSHIYQPPTTPSASSSLYRTTVPVSNEIDSTPTSRKRARHDSFQAPSHSPAGDWSPGLPSTLATSRTISPAPLVNTRYKLAGGLDTPTAFASAVEIANEDFTSADVTLRGGRSWDRQTDLFMDESSPQLSSALAREANGRPRIYKPPGIRDGLGKAVYRVVDAAGRVWEFCRANAFPGFFAGGGQGYEMKSSTTSANLDQSFWPEIDQGKSCQPTNGDITPVTGGFRETDFIPDYMSQDHTTPSRGAKRIQREKGEGGLGASWVVVGNGGVSRESSPSRLSNRKVPQSSASGRKPPSRAGRRPILPASRPSLTSYAGSPSLRLDRPASFASPRSQVTSPKHESPMSVDIQRHAARIRKRELEEDANLKRFNQQLKAMIREGKEALGTKIEVVEDPDGTDDEGYAEGDYFDERGK